VDAENYKQVITITRENAMSRTKQIDQICSPALKEEEEEWERLELTSSSNGIMEELCSRTP
jgi:peptidyl-tRNA hydrolase